MTLFYGWNVEPATIIFLAWMLSFTSEFSASLIINWLSLLFETWGRRRRLSLLLQTRNGELKGVCPREALQGHVQCCNLSPYLPMVYTFILYSSTDLESYLQYTNQNMLLSCFQNFHCATISYRIKTEFHLCKAVLSNLSLQHCPKWHLPNVSFCVSIQSVPWLSSNRASTSTSESFCTHSSHSSQCLYTPSSSFQMELDDSIQWHSLAPSVCCLAIPSALYTFFSPYFNYYTCCLFSSLCHEFFQHRD